jgi:calcineurin-like phosphoesterase family protein
MGTLYFTSDLHFNHKSILNPEYTNRWEALPCDEAHLTLSEQIEAHNRWIIDTITERVTDQINGHKHLVWGNHDSKLVDFYKASGLFETVTKYAEVIYSKKRLVLFHAPIAEWENGHHGAIHLHGHTHGNFDYERAGLSNKRILDVGWDNSKEAFGFYGPISFEQVESYMEGRESITHHGQAD